MCIRDRCTEVQVVGIDGIEEVRELVDEDKILGSVLCDTKLHAKALMQFIDVLAFHKDVYKRQCVD